MAAFRDDVEVRVVEYAPGKFAPVVSRGGKFEFRGGRVFNSHESAEAASADEVEFQRKFWGEQLDNRTNAAVINGGHYRIGTERAGRPDEHRGFGGRTHHLRDLATGEVVTSSDLWWQGLVPDFARDALPDSHEFVTTAEAGEPA